MADDRIELKKKDLEDFSDKIRAWSTELEPKEQAMLAILLGDVQPATTAEVKRDALITKFKEQVRISGLKGKVEYVIPKAGLAGKYCATVNVDKWSKEK